MLWLFLTTIIFACGVVILYLVIRALPRVREPYGAQPTTDPVAMIDTFIRSGMPERVDGFLRKFFEKTLKWCKTWLDRLDAFVTNSLTRVRSKGQASVFHKYTKSNAPEATPEVLAAMPTPIEPEEVGEEEKEVLLSHPEQEPPRVSDADPAVVSFLSPTIESKKRVYKRKAKTVEA